MPSNEQPPQHPHTIDDLPIGFGPGKIPTSDMVVVLIEQNGNIHLPVRNNTGGALLKGRLVAVTGSLGAGPGRRYTVAYADKDTPGLRPASAVLAADLPDGEDAYAIVAGVLTDVDTSPWALTDQLALGNAGVFVRPPPDTDPFTGEVQACGVVLRVGVADGAVQILVQGLDVLTAAAQFNAPRTLGRGWQSGGALTRTGGLNLGVDGGVGFVSAAGELTRVVWTPQVLLLAADSSLTVYIDSAGVAQSSALEVNADENIVLGQARTAAAAIPFLAFNNVHIERLNARLDRYLAEVIGTVAVSGVIGSINGGNPLRLDVSAGYYFANFDLAVVPATTPITFVYWFMDGLGGWTSVPGSTVIDTANYDDGSGVLAAIPAGEWKQDIVYVADPDEAPSAGVEYHVLYAQATFATQAQAEAAALPTPPLELQRYALRSSGAVVQQGAVAITSVLDQRPFLGSNALAAALTNFASITGTISDAQHGNRGGGALHALATALSAGFMSSADYTALQGATAPETSDYVLLPEGRVTGNATRVAQTVYEGASYLVRKSVTFDRILFRATAQAGAPTVAIHIFQAANGLSGVAARVATVTAFPVGAPGNFEAPLTEGSVTLAPGLCYILFGRDSAAGSATLRSYTTQNVDLLTANIQADTHPTSFTTAILANTTPATFDPVTEATGTASDVIGAFRLLTN